jgi:hypothetical protein
MTPWPFWLVFASVWLAFGVGFLVGVAWTTAGGHILEAKEMFSEEDQARHETREASFDLLDNRHRAADAKGWPVDDDGEGRFI